MRDVDVPTGNGTGTTLRKSEVRTTTTATRTMPKNIISRYCNYLTITPSFPASRKVCINTPGIKLVKIGENGVDI